MNNYYIKVGSVTHAMKGRDVLNSKGYRAVVRRTLKPYGSNEGCGYSIYIDKDIERAVQELREKNVKFTSYGSVSDFR